MRQAGLYTYQTQSIGNSNVCLVGRKVLSVEQFLSFRRVRCAKALGIVFTVLLVIHRAMVITFEHPACFFYDFIHVISIME